jgi:amidase
VNALPTLCLDRAREHARRIMQGGAACKAAGEAGWLAGLPVSIKDLTDVAGVRTTYGSPLFADHVPAKSHPLVERIERKGGIVMGKSNTPEFGAGGSTFNEVFGRTRNPWNTSLMSGGSTGGGAVSVATGEVWLAQGTDHGGSVARPGQPLLRRGPAAVAGARDARHRAQSLERAFRARADGPQCRRPGAVPRHDGGVLPT